MVSPSSTPGTTADDPKSGGAPIGGPPPNPSDHRGPKTDNGSPSHTRHHRGSQSGTTSSTQQTGARNTLAPAGGAPAALPRAGVVPPPAALPGLPLAPGLPLPGAAGVFAPSALAGGSLPGGLSSGLFGANFGNPALLAGTPLGAAAASLYQPQADSAVTTVSHSEALAAGAARGVGTPTAIAAIALACVVGILVRSRVLRRIAAREQMTGVLLDDIDGPSDAELIPADGDADHDLATADAPLLAA